MKSLGTSVTRRGALGLAAAVLALPRIVRAQDAALEVGVLPNISSRVLMQQYQPMREYLSRQLNRSVQVSTAPGWSAFHARAMALDYDVVVTASHVARVEQLDKGWKPLVSYMPDIKGMLLSPLARPMKQLDELRGQTLVLSNPQSLVTLRGMQLLAEKGLQRGRDFKTIDTPNDDSVGSVVVRGDAAAAMCSGGEYRAIPEATRAQLAPPVVFAEVPSFVVMASPKLLAPVAQAVKAQLLQFGASDEGKAFFSATGFTGMREVPAGMLEGMDAYVDATRRLLAG